MTATDQTTEVDQGSHASDWVYIKTAIWLGIFTAVEVFTYFQSVHNMPDWLLRVLLSCLMVIKFVMVAAIFMHLKYDDAIYTKLLAGGLALAYPVYMVAAFAMNWLPDWHWAVKVVTLVVPPAITAGWLLIAWQGGTNSAEARTA